MTDSNATELLPCAHCGDNGELVTYYDFYHINCTNKHCVEYYSDYMVYKGIGKWYGSIAEAIEAWNTRAAYETDDYFYLPKPKEKLVNFSEPIITPIENGVRANCGIEVIKQAVRKWQEQIERDSEKEIIERICEVFRPERTCKAYNTHKCLSGTDCPASLCSECNELFEEGAKYCSNCGAKVVS